ncbi:hypothetical protein Lnau_1102 [Legionella nautarum]|uniref:Transmembrane protein n=1 Tax=Legionella nautarum TaxID=45070 RepID=A0A0W0WV68_9GAMM|nr:hypothetical protein [Legionella nautarum]KTD36118.1 hypothetical protein Lnau_1102 [Legionella nautarum]
MAIFLFIQILCIIIGAVFLFIAFNTLRPKAKEQRLVQDRFLFYLILGLLFIFSTFLLEYLS